MVVLPMLGVAAPPTGTERIVYRSVVLHTRRPHLRREVGGHLRWPQRRFPVVPRYITHVNKKNPDPSASDDLHVLRCLSVFYQDCGRVLR